MPIGIDISLAEARVQLTFPERFDFYVAENFRAVFRKLPLFISLFELDMGNTRYIDSAALASLMLLRHEKPAGIIMMINNCNAEICQLLRTMKYDEMYEINGEALVIPSTRAEPHRFVAA